ncbi:MAG: metallophosphoesterase family protein [Mariniblastus sp.]|jgi:predicted phosphodiesterase|nr:metallophosphoesterase family protein [Planctomycetaceae bacterium]MDB4371415.1 metallophosphoesterase family protein [Mariniblastus sp.]MCP4479311.1 metallophosphoesterase family protein [Planctomycetaceae bacterium]MCP4778303.1 metallophosphoesterase family protein [Planctomycetaceae bacterium]MDG1512892.1 metallophosphoesterase family protein [Mariniblastus sp.]
MGKRAIISDIHGNFEALTAVLADIETQGISEIYCLGDVIGYGPNPRECIDRCREFALTLLGNHDNGALFDPEGFSSGAERAIFWTRSQLEQTEHDGAKERWDFLASLPRTHREGDFMFVHGSPRSPLNEYVFPEDVYNQRKIERIFGFIQKYCFQGHTHVPGVFTENFRFYSPSEISNTYTLGEQKLMINVGSVGQPRDSDPRGSYVILEGNEVEFRRVEYDPAPTRNKILGISELDDFLGDRLLEGR